MLVQHIAGLPVEEVLPAALAAAGPVIVLAWLELRARIKRLKDRFRGAGCDGTVGDGGRSPARLRDYEFGGSESGQGVDG